MARDIIESDEDACNDNGMNNSLDTEEDFDVADSTPMESGGDDYSGSSCGDYIDDAISFKNLTKMAAKSLKRKYAQKGVSKDNRKRVRTDVKCKMARSDHVATKASSRCNLNYFADIIADLSQAKKDIIKDYNFGFFLDFEKCHVPRSFVQWIVDHIDTRTSDIIVREKVIPISPRSIHHVLGIPIGGLEIKSDSDSKKNYLLEMFDQPNLPTIKFFGNKLLKDDLSRELVFICFMVVTLSTFLCPNSNTYPSPKYLIPLQDVDKVNDWDWSTFVYEWLMLYMKKYKKEKRNASQSSRTLGGCIYFLTAKPILCQIYPKIGLSQTKHTHYLLNKI